MSATISAEPSSAPANAGFTRSVLAWIVASLVAAILAVIVQTQRIIARLDKLDAGVTLSERLSMTGYDLVHFGSVYVPIVAIGLLVAFLAAALVYRLAGFGRPVVYAVAGGVAMIVILASIKHLTFGVQLVGGAREVLGFVLQVSAGVIGGLVFARLTRRRAT